jgi:hypothetical protein
VQVSKIADSPYLEIEAVMQFGVCVMHSGLALMIVYEKYNYTVANLLKCTDLTISST